MTENSLFWATNDVGDGAEIEQEQWFSLLRVLLTVDNTAQGTLGGGLGISGYASPVAVAAGQAIVYGIPYFNTAVRNIAVPTPSAGATAHRFVLQADWSTQTVRIALLSAADGVNTPPALTQTAGTKWEISLGSISIGTNGAITGVDERAPLQFNSALLQARQGGAVGDWSTVGTTTYKPGQVGMQAGSFHCTGAGPNSITFPLAFAEKPLVVVSIMGSPAAACYACHDNLSTSGFVAWVNAASNNAHVAQDVVWVAIGRYVQH